MGEAGGRGMGREDSLPFFGLSLRLRAVSFMHKNYYLLSNFLLTY
jgi:hypothetical protein